MGGINHQTMGGFLLLCCLLNLFIGLPEGREILFVFFGGVFCIIPNRAVPFVRIVYFYSVYHRWAIPYITGLSMWLLTSYEPGDVLLQFLPNSQKWSNMDEPTMMIKC